MYDTQECLDNLIGVAWLGGKITVIQLIISLNIFENRNSYDFILLFQHIFVHH